MSQVPPNYGGQSPVTQPPGGYQPPAQKSNPLAIVSLICGIIGCLVITPIVGIITGAIALAQSKEKGGKGMAIAGIVLSILWIVVGIGLYAAGAWGVGKLNEMVGEIAKQPVIVFTNHLATGNIDEAEAMSDLSRGELERLSEQLKPLGTLQDIEVTNPNYENVNGVVRASFLGTAKFEKQADDGTVQETERSIQATVTERNDAVVVQEFELR